MDRVKKFYRIRDKNTGKFWQTKKGKCEWAGRGHASNAYNCDTGKHFRDQNDLEIVELEFSLVDSTSLSKFSPQYHQLINSKQLKEFQHIKIDEKELWSLDATIAEFVVPRLELMLENLGHYPGTDECPDMETYANIINHILDSLRILRNCYSTYLVDFNNDPEFHKYFKDGLKLFAEYLPTFWD